jgi:muramidase (phage lysozyme)
MLAASDNGFDVCVGSTPERPILFPSYFDHPYLRDDKTNSDAAGRYQIMGWIWSGHDGKSGYRQMLSLPDFGPHSQDLVAIRLIHECGAADDIEAGRIEVALTKCRSRWASLPGAGYGQHEQKMAALVDAFKDAGGVVA